MRIDCRAVPNVTGTQIQGVKSKLGSVFGVYPEAIRTSNVFHHGAIYPLGTVHVEPRRLPMRLLLVLPGSRNRLIQFRV